MNCLKCGNQMEQGFLKSNTEISWMNNPYFDSGKESDINNSNNSNISFNPSILLRSFRCLRCNRIELSFDRPNQIPCQVCGKYNSGSNKFCSNCGEEIKLTTEDSTFLCVDCKSPIGINDICCPSCGVNIDQFASDLLNTCVECGYSDPSLEDMAECPRCRAILPI